MQGLALQGGFDDQPVDAARVFRAALEAMARPGRIERAGGAAPPAPLSPAAGALVLTLCDHGTPVHLAGAFDCAEVRDWITFHTGAPFAAPAACAFAIGRWQDLVPLDRFPAGTPDYPDRSATLIVETDRLAEDGARLTGPGIPTFARLPLPETEAFRLNAARFPLGVDFYFTCGDRLAGLPRTTNVEAA